MAVRRQVHPVIVELKQARLARGIGQEKLSEAIGYHHDTVRVWESGTKTPRLVSVVDWAQALGYRLELVAMDREP